MIIVLHKNFKKKYKKLPKVKQKKFKERRNLFLREPSHPQLNDHALHGDLFRYRSFNVTGDLRVYYEQIEEDVVLFTDIDTHSNLYS